MDLRVPRPVVCVGGVKCGGVAPLLLGRIHTAAGPTHHCLGAKVWLRGAERPGRGAAPRQAGERNYPRPVEIHSVEQCRGVVAQATVVTLCDAWCEVGQADSVAERRVVVLGSEQGWGEPCIMKKAPELVPASGVVVPAGGRLGPTAVPQNTTSSPGPRMSGTGMPATLRRNATEQCVCLGTNERRAPADE